MIINIPRIDPQGIQKKESYKKTQYHAGVKKEPFYPYTLLLYPDTDPFSTEKPYMVYYIYLKLEPIINFQPLIQLVDGRFRVSNIKKLMHKCARLFYQEGGRNL